MSRRICLPLLVTMIALAAPSASPAQTSSQAQYQGVAPETQTPVGGTGNGTNADSGGSAVSGGSGGGPATGGGSAGSGGSATSGASGNGGTTGGTAAQGGSTAVAATPSASSDTAPFSGGDWVWIVLACGGLAGLGFVLRRTTRTPAGT
jgi:cobalamin biosynthesis Mg chelatase CobN